MNQRALNSETEFQEFMKVLYRALMMVARWIEKKYLGRAD